MSILGWSELVCSEKWAHLFLLSRFLLRGWLDRNYHCHLREELRVTFKKRFRAHTRTQESEKCTLLAPWKLSACNDFTACFFSNEDCTENQRTLSVSCSFCPLNSLCSFKGKFRLLCSAGHGIVGNTSSANICSVDKWLFKHQSAALTSEIHSSIVLFFLQENTISECLHFIFKERKSSSRPSVSCPGVWPQTHALHHCYCCCF